MDIQAITNDAANAYIMQMLNAAMQEMQDAIDINFDIGDDDTDYISAAAGIVHFIMLAKCSDEIILSDNPNIELISAIMDDDEMKEDISTLSSNAQIDLIDDFADEFDLD